jgi:D-alanyl-D-alanine carboxypeptidase
VAVFVGKLTLVDGDEGHEVRAGEAALVADPTATLYLQAGNDAAVAIGFAEPGVLVRLG